MTLEQVIQAFLNHTYNAQGRYSLSVRNGALYSYYLQTTPPTRQGILKVTFSF